MKTIPTASAVAVSIAAALYLATSCIYDAPGDKFYRTLWMTEDPTLGNLTIEFMCDNQISASSDLSSGAYGTYESHDYEAEFEGLTLIFDRLVIKDGNVSASDLADVSVHLTRATRSGDSLLIHWYTDQADGNFTVTLKRLSAYQ